MACAKRTGSSLSLYGKKKKLNKRNDTVTSILGEHILKCILQIIPPKIRIFAATTCLFWYNTIKYAFFYFYVGFLLKLHRNFSDYKSVSFVDKGLLAAEYGFLSICLRY
jgi:hypothetical protein